MTVCLMVIHDGRHDYLERTMASAGENLPAFDHEVVVDDTAHTLGFGGAIREGWRRVLETDAEFVFHLEGDFTFPRPVPVDDMIAVLRARPYLTQMALLRQPWNDEEKAAGSIFDLISADLELNSDDEGRYWLEHRRPNTTNPSIWPRWVLERGWPDVRHSEGVFGGELMKSDHSLRAAYWGQGEENCFHIGDERTGVGY